MKPITSLSSIIKHNKGKDGDFDQSVDPGSNKPSYFRFKDVLMFESDGCVATNK